MKNVIPLRIPCVQTAFTLALVSSFFILPFTLVAQGNLTPPGAPAPTMRTLDQIESRTPISSAPFTITEPGSYYLTTNLTVSSGNAITITTSCVTLDLNGFTLFSTAPSATGSGIEVYCQSHDTTIRNGHIRGGVTNDGIGNYSGSGFLHGIYKNCGSDPVNVLVSCVSVSGCGSYGIYAGFSHSVVVERCTVRTVGGYGIVAGVVREASATDCGNIAIYASVASDCVGESTSGNGVSATVVRNCHGTGGGGSGAGVYGLVALNCSGSNDSGGSGVFVHAARNCEGSSGGNWGVRSQVARSCYGRNTGGGWGLQSDNVAIGCMGTSVSGTGLQTTIGNTCYGASSSGTPQSVASKYNMP